MDLTIADNTSYAELNSMLEEYVQSQVKKGIKQARALGRVPRMNTNKQEFVEMYTRWSVYTYTKLLSEQIFVPLMRQIIRPSHMLLFRQLLSIIFLWVILVLYTEVRYAR